MARIARQEGPLGGGEERLVGGGRARITSEAGGREHVGRSGWGGGRIDHS